MASPQASPFISPKQKSCLKFHALYLFFHRGEERGAKAIHNINPKLKGGLNTNTQAEQQRKYSGLLGNERCSVAHSGLTFPKQLLKAFCSKTGCRGT